MSRRKSHRIQTPAAGFWLYRLTVKQVLFADQSEDTFNSTADMAIKQMPVVATRVVLRQNCTGQPLAAINVRYSFV